MFDAWRLSLELGVVTLAIGLVGCTVQADDDDWADPPLGEVREALTFSPNLPYPAGTSMGVSQGWGGSWSHTGNLHYAIDFNLPGTADLGIHVLAVADGTVTYRHDDCTCEGCSCNSGWGNAIVIDHGGGEFSKQTHLQTGSIPSWIQVGTPVCRGLYVGGIGNTGNSSGSHLHFQFQSAGTLSGPSISFDQFVETSGVPQEGGSYLSANQELAACGPPQPCSITVAGDATVIDDQSDCFHRVGAYWWEESYGHDGHHWFTYTTDEPSPDSSASWEVNTAAAGDYQVEVFVPNNTDSLTQAVPYSIHHDGVQDQVTVDQAAHRGEWVALGTYHFAEGGDQAVTIVDNTGEPYGGTSGRRLLLDAVRLSTSGGCSDACSLGKRCGGEGWQECGQFDSDSCLEWGGGGVCEPGTQCAGQGACVPDEEPVPEEGDEPDHGLEGSADPDSADPDGTDPLADGSNAALHGFTCALAAPRPSDGSSPAYLLWLLLAVAGLSLQRRRPRHRLSMLVVPLGALAMACSVEGPSLGDGGSHGGDGGGSVGGGSGGVGAAGGTGSEGGAGVGAGSEGGAGAGSPSFCAELADGQWCDSDNLLTCVGGDEVALSECHYGCDSSPQGGSHACTEPNPDACIGKMNGKWCDLTDLVFCQDDDVLWRIHCSSGCESMPSGTPDRCYPVSFCAAVPDPVSPTAPTDSCNYMDWDLSPDGFYLISRFGTSADQTTWGHGTTCGYLQGHYDYNSCRYDVHSSSCLDDDTTIPWAQGHVDYDYDNVVDTVNTHMIGDVPDAQIFYVADAQRFNCGAVLRVSNPETNRCVVVYTEDGGPGTLYEGPNYGARRILDASPAVSHYLLVDDWGWASSDLVYVEWGLPGDVPGHACTPCQSTAVETGTEAMRTPYDPNHMQSGLDCR